MPEGVRRRDVSKRKGWPAGHKRGRHKQMNSMQVHPSQALLTSLGMPTSSAKQAQEAHQLHAPDTSSSVSSAEQARVTQEARQDASSPHALGDALFREQRKRARVRGVVQVGAAAELDGVRQVVLCKGRGGGSPESRAVGHWRTVCKAQNLTDISR